MKTLTKKRLLSFDFKFIRKVTRDLYEIIDAREFARHYNAKKPHFIDSECIAFWSDFDCDHATIIRIKNILPFK